MTDRQVWANSARWLMVFLLAGAASPVWSAACDAVFTNGVQSHSASGSVNANFQTEIIGGGSQLDTPSLTTGGQVTCGGSSCSASGTPAATGSPAFEVGNGTDGDINAAGPPGNTTNVTEGDYTSVSVVQRRILDFSTSSGTYLMESLTSNFQSEVRFSAGDYWIDGDMTIGQETDLVMQGGGTVRIFVNGNVNLGYQVESLGFSPDQLLIYATGDITLTDNQVTLSGFLYAGGQFQSSFQSEITGGVSGASVTLDNETRIDYAGDVLDTAAFAPFCGEAAPGLPEPAGYWAMDESSWTGASGEVLDSSGNGNHGTAQNGASTDSAAPAIAGDPGTCGYGEFDGNNDYVSVPNLSDTLGQTASLAFWIKTTDTGSSSVWLSPAVAGVEESGGVDDIFWGWLNPQGRIGLGVGNDNTAVSNSAVNTGQWVHVALTRNHQSGDYQIFVNGSLETTGTSGTGVIGNGFSSIGRVENTGSADPIYLEADLDEIRVYDGVLSESEVADIYSETHPCSSTICAAGTPVPGLLGEYFDNQSLSGEPANTRVDAPVQFTWEFGEGPSVLGGRDDDFSIRWEGRVFVTETGNYRFRTLSDDGVRLWVDGQPVLSNWDDHAVETDTTTPISLEADQAYDIRLDFYENGGRAQIELLWSTPSTGNFVPIPAGDSGGTAAGLYHCPGRAVANYTLSHGATGITCEALQVDITAVDSAGNPVAPPAGTEIVLGTTPTTSDSPWANGTNVHQFSGSDVGVTKYLHWDTEGDVSLSVTDGTVQNSSGPITFSDVGLRFYNNATDLGALPDQIAGQRDGAPVLRAVKTDDETGACIARLSGEEESVGLAYECRNPGTCVSGQSLELADTPVAANNLGATLTYTGVGLVFDGDGFASIPVSYSDVGRVRLHARLDLPQENEQPAETLLGSSGEFVVKPYSLRVSGVQTPAGVESPGTDSNTGTEPDEDAFVAAGEPFSVTVEAVNALGNVTPNFGNENPAEEVFLELTDLYYPAGGDLGVLGGAESLSSDGGGSVSSDTVSWNNVGAVRFTPKLVLDKDGDGVDEGYLGAGALPQVTESAPIGRFYPYDFSFPGGSVENACDAGGYSYMGHMAIKSSYAINARNFANQIVSNYDDAAGYNDTATVRYVAENADSGDGASLSSRVQVDDEAAQWTNGVLSVNPSNTDLNAAFLRALDTRPDGPYNQLAWGVILEDNLDNRPSDGLNMNATDNGDCTAAGNCTAWALSGVLDARFGRLKLENAFGPEVLDLPAPFYTEYWNGSEFVRNADDSCTRIPRSAITYEPTGPLTDDTNRTVPIGGGSTTGQYDNLDAASVQLNNSYSGQTFTAPGEGNTGSFDILIDLTNRPWLRFDWNQDGDHNNDAQMPPANVGFGSYRGHDRVIYWREVLE